MSEKVLRKGRVAVVTGAASGIGLAASKHFASLGMKVLLADVAENSLEAAVNTVASLAPGGHSDVLAYRTDVSKPEALFGLRKYVYQNFGEVGLLMNNAATFVRTTSLHDRAAWQKTLDTNMWGVINGVQAFAPAMLEQNTRCLIINTGSKQGITNPPGNTGYNVAKAAVKAFTESLAHELRNTVNCQITAHLLVPGWTSTGGQQGSWTPAQVVEVLVQALLAGDFYIICPDGEVTRDMDNKRILWSAGDMVANRPALSRWHPDFEVAYKEFSSGTTNR